MDKPKKTESLSVRVDETLFKKLDKLCYDTERSKGYHVSKALDSYLRKAKEIA